MPGRIYGKGEKPADVFSQYAGSNQNSRYYYLRIGRVIEIDYERYQFKIEWITGGGSPQWIPISFPYVGPAGCIGTTPEIGSLGIFGYLNEGSGTGTPMCLSFLPVSMQAALDHTAVKQTPDSLPTEELNNVVYLKFRPLQKGDVIMSSPFGGEVFLNKDVEIKDSMRNQILIRSSDHSIVSTSLNNFQFTDGIAFASGQVIRNKVNIFDHEGNRIPDQLARETSGPDGRDTIYIVPYGAPIDDKSQFFTEFRVDVSDLGDGQLDVNDINSQATASLRDPIVTMAMGNYVGSIESTKRYGKLLRPVLFSSAADTVGNFDLLECVQRGGLDQASNLGMAYAVHMLKNDSFLGFDKEGHYYLNLNASSAVNPLGAGRSMSVLARGNLKEIWGSAPDDGNSWDLATKGGVKWNIGAHSGKFKGRSVDITTSSGYRLEVQSADDDGFAKRELILGNQLVNVGGVDTKAVTGNSELTVDGLRKETIRGCASYDYMCDKTENCLGVYSQIVIKEMQGRFGKRKETVLQGQELEIILGNDKETIKLGSKKTEVLVGNIEEKILLGQKKVSIIVGKYVVDVKAGNVEIKTLAGQVKIQGLLGVTVQGLKANIQAVKVGLGMAPIGNVVVGLSGPIPMHLDYMTGMPLMGTLTVKAGP